MYFQGNEPGDSLRLWVGLRSIASHPGLRVCWRQRRQPTGRLAFGQRRSTDGILVNISPRR